MVPACEAAVAALRTAGAAAAAPAATRAGAIAAWYRRDYDGVIENLLPDLCPTRPASPVLDLPNHGEGRERGGLAVATLGNGEAGGRGKKKGGRCSAA